MAGVVQPRGLNPMAAAIDRRDYVQSLLRRHQPGCRRRHLGGACPGAGDCPGDGILRCAWPTHRLRDGRVGSAWRSGYRAGFRCLRCAVVHSLSPRRHISTNGSNTSFGVQSRISQTDAKVLAWMRSDAAVCLISDDTAGRGVRAADLGWHECRVVAGFDQVGYVGVPEALQSQFFG